VSRRARGLFARRKRAEPLPAGAELVKSCVDSYPDHKLDEADIALLTRLPRDQVERCLAQLSQRAMIPLQYLIHWLN
jgi:hypothetical protein